MAILIIEQQGQRQAGTLKGRVLIGRWPDLTLVIDDRAVSRIHAWIGLQEGRYYIADAGSRTGTFVNGERLSQRHVLADGDQIRIGPVVLRYRTDPSPPPDIPAIDLSPQLPAQLSGEQGVFMDCVCGAPLWLPRQFEGVGQCRYCGHTVTQGAAPSTSLQAANNRPATKAVPAASPTKRPDPTPAVPAASPTKRPDPTPPALEQAAPPAPPADKDDDDFDALILEAFTASESPAPPATVGTAARTPPVKPSGQPAARTSGSSKVIPPMPNPPPPVASAPSLPAPLPLAPVGPRSPTRIPSVAGPVIPPAAPALHAPKASPVTKVENARICGVCHAAITIFDDVTECPSCSLVFHVDCWQENRGCSAYGCAQVGALGGKEKPA